MTKSKGQQTPPTGHVRFGSVAEIRQHIAKLAERIEHVQELTQEGLPYAEASKVKVELGARETIREIFGEGSREFEACRHFTINTSSHAAIGRSVTMLQDLIAILEDQEAVLLGKPRPPRRAPRPPLPEPPASASTAPVQPRPAVAPKPPVSAGGRPPAAPHDVQAVPRESAKAPKAPSPAPPPRQTSLVDALARIRTICIRFHGIVRQLRERSEGRLPFEIEDEYDVRDLLRALLHLEFDEVQTEESTAPGSAGITRTDLVIHPVGIVVVATKTRRGIGAKELNEFWSDAARRYAKRDGCRILFGFIYDPEGRIGTPRRLEADLLGIETGGKGEVHILPK